jgi:hypothetical protein
MSSCRLSQRGRVHCGSRSDSRDSSSGLARLSGVSAKPEGPRLAIKGQLRTNRLNFDLERTRRERASFLHTAPKLAAEQAGDFTWPPQLPVLQVDAFSCST